MRKQIVHNTHVVASLETGGTIFVDELDEIPDPAPPGSVVVFSAHGVSPAVQSKMRARGLQVIDATCPLLTKVHAETRRFAARSDTIVLIDHAGQEEVEGTMVDAPGQTVLVETPANVAVSSRTWCTSWPSTGSAPQRGDLPAAHPPPWQGRPQPITVSPGPHYPPGLPMPNEVDL